jgi:hypothetical protein
VTSGTDDPQPTGAQPAGADPDPGPSIGSMPRPTADPQPTQPWRPTAAMQDEPTDSSQQARSEGGGQPRPEIHPLPGGGWTSSPPREQRDDPARPPSADRPSPAASVPAATPHPAATTGAPTSPRPAYGGAPTRPTGTQARPATGAAAAPVRKGGRRARLTVKRVDPWSTLKFAFIYSLAGVVVLLVAAAVLYLVVDAMGVIDSVRTFLNDVEGGSSGLSKWLGFGRVMTIAVVIGIVNVVLFTAFATLTAFVYNVCTEIVGGIEVTLADTATGATAEVASSGGKGL